MITFKKEINNEDVIVIPYPGYEATHKRLNIPAEFIDNVVILKRKSAHLSGLEGSTAIYETTLTDPIIKLSTSNITNNKCEMTGSGTITKKNDDFNF